MYMKFEQYWAWDRRMLGSASFYHIFHIYFVILYAYLDNLCTKNSAICFCFFGL